LIFGSFSFTIFFINFFFFLFTLLTFFFLVVYYLSFFCLIFYGPCFISIFWLSLPNLFGAKKLNYCCLRNKSYRWPIIHQKICKGFNTGDNKEKKCKNVKEGSHHPSNFCTQCYYSITQLSWKKNMDEVSACPYCCHRTSGVRGPLCSPLGLLPSTYPWRSSSVVTEHIRGRCVLVFLEAAEHISSQPRRPTDRWQAINERVRPWSKPTAQNASASS
jgi:hypothetical protein